MGISFFQFSECLSLRTPAEIAEIENNQEAIRLIKKKVKLTEKLSQQKQPWATQESRKKQELEGKVKEAAKSLPSLFSNYPDAKEASQAIQKIVAVAEAASPLHSNASEMEEEMKKGAIPFGMWHRILGQLEILEKGSQAA